MQAAFDWFSASLVAKWSWYSTVLYAYYFEQMMSWTPSLWRFATQQLLFVCFCSGVSIADSGWFIGSNVPLSGRENSKPFC